MSASKFKLGQEIRIKNDLVPSIIEGKINFVLLMEKYKSKKATVIKVKSDCYKLNIDKEEWNWTDEMLEPVLDYYEKEYTCQELIPIIQDGQEFESISDGFRVKTISRRGNRIIFNGKENMFELLDKGRFPIQLNQQFKLKQPDKKEHKIYHVSLSKDRKEINFVVKYIKDHFLVGQMVSCNIGDKKCYGKIEGYSYEGLSKKEYLEFPTIEEI